MPATVSYRSLDDGIELPWPGIPRPVSEVAWTGGTGPFNVIHEWDTVTTFDSGNLLQDVNNGVTSPNNGVPPADLGPFGTAWFYRATVVATGEQQNEIQKITHDHTGGDFTLSFDGEGPTSVLDWNATDGDIKTALEALANITTVTVTKNADGDWDVEFVDPGNQDLPLMTIDDSNLTGGTGSGVSATQEGVSGESQGPTWTLNWVDSRLDNRYLYALAKTTAAHHPTDEQAWGWGTGIGGTEGSDGVNVLMNRYLYLLAKTTAGFRFTDEPDWGWNEGIGGTWGDGDERLMNRYLYLLTATTTDIPTPFLFSLAPQFGRPGDSFQINGWGLKPRNNWAEGMSYSGGPGGTSLTDGHLPRQDGSVTEVSGAFVDRGTNNDVIDIDLGAPRDINEVRVWYRLSDPFTSLEVFHADSAGGPWTSAGSGTPAQLDPEGTGWATIQKWDVPTSIGTHRYWRFQFVDAQSIGELEVNRRMTVPTGDIEPRLDDTDTDWLMTISQDFYDRIIAQAPNSTEPGGDVRVQNVWPDPDLVSNEKHFTFLDPIPAKDVGVLVKVFDRDAPQQLIAIAGDADGVQFQNLLSGVGSAEFTIPHNAPAFEEADFEQHYNVVRIYLDQIERWWGFVTWTGQTLVDDAGRHQEATRFVCRHGMSYVGRYGLIPANWPSLDDPVHQFVEKTAGEILIDLIGKGQADGFLDRLSWTFTGAKDSNNENWDDVFNLEFQPGTNLMEVVSQLVSLGIDVRMDSQFRLHAFNKLGFDRATVNDQPVFVGHTVQALSEVEDFQAPGNVALIAYGDGKYLLYQDNDSIAEWDKHLKFAQTSADNATSAQRLAEVAVERAGQPQDKIAIGMHRIREEVEPYVDFDIGDTIRIVDKQKDFDQQYRVRGITVDAGDVRFPQFILELNSLRLEKVIEHEILLNKQLQNTLPIEIASSEPGGAARREHDHKFPDAGGDIAGTLKDPVVTGWQGTPIDPGPFSDGDMWAFDQESGGWIKLSPSEQGDIFYWDGSDWVAVAGPKGPGVVPTIQADGSVAWAAGGGGGGGAGSLLANEVIDTAGNEFADVVVPVGTAMVKIFFRGRGAADTNAASLQFRFGDSGGVDTGSNYFYDVREFVGSSNSSSSDSATSINATRASIPGGVNPDTWLDYGLFECAIMGLPSGEHVFAKGESWGRGDLDRAARFIGGWNNNNVLQTIRVYEGANGWDVGSRLVVVGYS